MNIFKLLFELFIFYILYKIVFDFIIPVYRASKRMKDQVGQMQQKMQEHQQRQNFPDENFVKNDSYKDAPGKPAAKDYIEFEELK
jgi:hypothetical protein